MQSNILFVDDDAAVLDALEWTFSDEPYGCFTCKNVDDALHLVDEVEFAVVISDHRMPEMSGVDFLRKIKHLSPATIRILMTAYQEMNIILNAVNRGHVYNLIFKPWDEAEFKRVVRTAVDTYLIQHNNQISSQQSTKVDDLIKANQNLEKRNQFLMAKLQQSQKMETLGNLASGIAHDFNNILLITQGILQLTINDRSIDPKALRSNLRMVLDASDRARDIISQIHSFIKASEYTKEPVELGPLIEKALAFIFAIIPKNVEIRQDIPSTDDKTLLDAAKVYQILLNLCSNAFDAVRNIEKGIVFIRLNQVQIDQEEQLQQIKIRPGKYFCLTVSDNGEGINKANIQHIFDPYFTTKHDKGGTGLGLALINQIVQEHEGYISVQSEVDEGTSFSLYVPQVEDNEHQDTV